MRNNQMHSPAPSESSSGLTLADVLDAVEMSPDLSPVRIRDLRSAISRFCALTGEEPGRIALDLAQLRNRLNAINPVTAGISPKSLANIRSDLFTAITASGLKPISPTRRSLTEPWLALRSMLRTKRWRIGLSRLLHYGSAKGIEPSEINDDVIAGFMESVREASLHRKPNDLHRQTAVIWNEIVSDFPELGLRPVSVPSFRPPPRRIEWSLLPESFRKDLEECLAWCADTDPFAADARSRPLAPGSINLRRIQIHAAVTALLESGLEPETVTALADLVSANNFERIARQRLKMAQGRENTFNRSMAAALVQIAREWVKVDDTTLVELKRLAGKLPTPRADLTPKNKRFLRQFDDPLVLQRLRALPAKLWPKVRRDEKPNFRTLALAQAALALEILTYLPIRIQNLISLSFDVHLFLQERPGAISTLDIPANEVKNKRAIEFDIPAHIVRMLIEYRDQLAPKIIGRKPDHLFINPDGTRKHAQTLSHLIVRIVRKYAGVDFSPHQSRHLAAKIILDDSPGSFELVKQLLGHENLKTTTNAYAGIDTRRAARHHHRLLQRETEQKVTPLRRSVRKRKIDRSD
jgi:integrase